MSIALALFALGVVATQASVLVPEFQAGSLYTSYNKEYASTYNNYEPRSYAFEYGVSDPHSGDHKTQWETKDKEGTVRGSYSLLEPDGTTRIVDYIADEHGFRAVVKKVGIHGTTVEAHGVAQPEHPVQAVAVAAPLNAHPTIIEEPLEYKSYDGGYEAYSHLKPVVADIHTNPVEYLKAPKAEGFIVKAEHYSPSEPHHPEYYASPEHYVASEHIPSPHYVSPQAYSLSGHHPKAAGYKLALPEEYYPAQSAEYIKSDVKAVPEHAIPEYIEYNAKSAPEYVFSKYVESGEKAVPEHVIPEYINSDSKASPEYAFPEFIKSHLKAAPEYVLSEYIKSEEKSVPEHIVPEYIKGEPEYAVPAFIKSDLNTVPEYAYSKYLKPQLKVVPEHVVSKYIHPASESGLVASLAPAPATHYAAPAAYEAAEGFVLPDVPITKPASAFFHDKHYEAPKSSAIVLDSPVESAKYYNQVPVETLKGYVPEETPQFVVPANDHYHLNVNYH